MKLSIKLNYNIKKNDYNNMNIIYVIIKKKCQTLKNRKIICCQLKH